MGARGILLVGEKEQYLAVPPPVKVVNTIGAGDSAVAGFVSELLTGKTMQEALVCGVAAGTATTLRPGPALCTKDDFLELIPQVKLFQEEDISKVIPENSETVTLSFTNFRFGWLQVDQYGIF